MEMKKYKLGEIAYFVDDKISSDEISLNEYITTDCLLQNKKGRAIATNLPPQPCSLTKFKKGDVLIGNIRPYLKKIWLADIDGGCSLDVLALRAKNEDESAYLYSLLMQDNFYDFIMKATKGSKMPRGDKNHILTFPCFDIPHKTKIGNFIKSLDDKIALNRRINAKLEAMAKRLYDHWFVQFDFPFDFAQGKPNADGKPYKASGGKMEYNEVLKRDIPQRWEVKKLGDIIIEIPKSKIQVNQVKNEGDIPFFTSGENILKTDKPLTNGAKIFLSTGGNAVIKLYVGDAAYSTDTYCIEFDEYTFYIYLLLKSMVDYINTNLFTGSGLKHLQKEQFKSLYCVLPPKQLLKSFNRLVSTSYTHISRNTLQQEKLTALRDRLLPLLMNGQVQI